MISSPCLSMIFSENRFPLFRIMLQGTPDAAHAALHPGSGQRNQKRFRAKRMSVRAKERVRTRSLSLDSD
ncbi:hypothetical protein [Bradyrhizobium brasilense]|uniref:hypothetical protein n=1 Tax=Bradyrhizobium brasilense TaxID=1419277 RepID=UPI001456C691|nr:hypothetical protein [Bradyrhizobium brasilense]